MNKAQLKEAVCQAIDARFDDIEKADPFRSAKRFDLIVILSSILLCGNLFV